MSRDVVFHKTTFPFHTLNIDQSLLDFITSHVIPLLISNNSLIIDPVGPSTSNIDDDPDLANTQANSSQSEHVFPGLPPSTNNY